MEPAGGFHSTSKVEGAMRVQASNEDTTREMPASPNWLDHFIDEALTRGAEQSGIAPAEAGADNRGTIMQRHFRPLVAEETGSSPSPTSTVPPASPASSASPSPTPPPETSGPTLPGSLPLELSPSEAAAAPAQPRPLQRPVAERGYENAEPPEFCFAELLDTWATCQNAEEEPPPADARSYVWNARSYVWEESPPFTVQQQQQLTAHTSFSLVGMLSRQPQFSQHSSKMRRSSRGKL